VLKLLEAALQEVCEERSLHGTANDVTSQIERYARAGMRYIILWNKTLVLDYKEKGALWRA